MEPILSSPLHLLCPVSLSESPYSALFPRSSPDCRAPEPVSGGGTYHRGSYAVT